MKPEKEDLRIQYHECLENYRMLDRHVWQVPSIAILITSAIVGVSFGYLRDERLASIILLVLGICLSLSMFLTVKKYRFFQHYAIERMWKIEDELQLEHMPIVTGAHGMIPRNMLEKLRAGNWLANILLIVSLLLTTLLIFRILIKTDGLNS